MTNIEIGNFGVPPVSYSIGFLRAPFELSVKSFVRWQRITLRCVRSERRDDADLKTTLMSLSPLSVNKTKTLFVATKSDWTAVFVNNALHGQPGLVTSYLAEKLGCDGLSFTVAPDNLVTDSQGGKTGVWGAFAFRKYGPVPLPILNTERVISLIHDVDGCEFRTQGEPLEFEDVEKYTARRRKDRLTPEMLVSYAKHYGIDLLNDDFYSGPSVTVHAKYFFETIHGEISIEDQQRKLGLIES